MAYDDVLRRDRRARIQRLDLVVIPLGYFARVNVCDYRTRQAQSAGEAREVVRDHDRAHHAREVQDFSWRIAQLLIGHRRVTRTDIDGAIRKHPDAAAGTDRLVVELDTRIFLGVNVE